MDFAIKTGGRGGGGVWEEGGMEGIEKERVRSRREGGREGGLKVTTQKRSPTHAYRDCFIFAASPKSATTVLMEPSGDTCMRQFWREKRKRNSAH